MKLLYTLFIVFSVSFVLKAQINVSLNINNENNEVIPFPTIKIQSIKNNFIIGDSLGIVKYSIIKNQVHELEISRIGFIKKTIKLSVSSDTNLFIVLKSNEDLQEVTILESKYSKSSTSNNQGVITITKNTLDALPNIGGEKDIIKAIQLLPGVQSGNDGTRGVFIRGGSPDQTLILLDHTPVYNVTHLYGFMSVFNGESIDKVELHKNQYPARFGGRLAAVVDIKSNFGNNQKIKGSATIGFLSSRITVEGPLGKNKKTTFCFSIRGAYIGLYASPISKKQFARSGYNGNISYNFYDINFAFMHRFSDKDILKISSFYSQDIFGFNRNNDTKGTSKLVSWNSSYNYTNDVYWRNNTFSVQWEHKKNERLSSNLTFYISNYTLTNKFNESTIYQEDIKKDEDIKKYNNKNYVSDYAIKNEWTYTFDKNKLLFGAQITYRPYQIGNGTYQKIKTNKTTIDTTYGNTLNKTLENTLFIEDEYQVSDKFIVNCGFHVVHYLNDVHHFFSFQPRLSILAEASKNIHIRASFLTSTQNIHLLTSGSAIVLTDLWVPATSKLKPESAWQISGGIQIDLLKQFQFSIDAFYKRMKDVIEYKNGVSKILIGDNWQNQILGNGKGEAYGTEFYISKTKGKFTAWAKYNLAWTYRQFDDLNDGKKFFYKYDRRHDISIVLAYKLNKHFDFSLTWIYATGNWMSLWKSKYPSQYTSDIYNIDNSFNQIPFIISNKERNNYRLPSYHHLDFGFNYTKQNIKTTHVLNVSIYNLYNHFNVFDVYSLKQYDANGKEYHQTKALTLFPIIPSISYTIKF